MVVARLLFIIGFILLIGGMAFFAACEATDATAFHDALGLREAAARVDAAAARLREARYVEDKTREVNGLYGTGVGRWVWLARDVGWPKTQINKLMYVIHRESGGNPYAKNSSSTASGLLQFLSSWWSGRWNPFNPRANLRHGYLAWKSVGWQPWSL